MELTDCESVYARRRHDTSKATTMELLLNCKFLEKFQNFLKSVNQAWCQHTDILYWGQIRV